MKKSKKLSKLFIIIPTVICLCIVLYFTINIVFSPYWGSVYAPDGYLTFNSIKTAESADVIYTKDEAVEDIDYVVSCLARVHPLFKDGITEEVESLVEDEKNSWGESVSSYEIWRSVARILNLVGDEHTMVSPSFSRLYLTDYLSKTESGYEAVAINGKDIDEIFAETKSLFSYQLEPWGINALENCFETLEGLKFIGIDTSEIEFTYKAPNGDLETVVYNESDFVDYETAENILQTESDDTPSYTYQVDKEKDVGILTLYTCEYDSEYKEFIYNFFTEVIEGDVGNVVVDLRENFGGNSQVADEFVLYLDRKTVKTPAGEWRLGPYTMTWDAKEENISHYDEMLFDGDVYVLTSSNTFSSATMFAEIISDNGFGKIIGEECGNMPSGYGDVVVFQTPNSLLSFQISSKFFERIDTSKSNQPLIPDYECDAEFALQKALDIIDSKNK